MTCDKPSTTVLTHPRRGAGRRHVLSLAIAVLTLGLVGEATAAEPSQSPPQIVNGNSAGSCSSLADCDRRAYDYSGTRGRMGLGANPAHPEGPGNAPN